LDGVGCRKRVEPDFEGFKGPPDAKPHFAFPLRDRFIQEGVGFKLLASIDGKPPPSVNRPVDDPCAVFYTNVFLWSVC